MPSRSPLPDLHMKILSCEHMQEVHIIFKVLNATDQMHCYLGRLITGRDVPDIVNCHIQFPKTLLKIRYSLHHARLTHNESMESTSIQQSE